MTWGSELVSSAETRADLYIRAFARLEMMVAIRAESVLDAIRAECAAQVADEPDVRKRAALILIASVEGGIQAACAELDAAGLLYGGGAQ